MCSISSEHILMGAKFLQEQLSQNITNLQSNPEQVVMGLLSALQLVNHHEYPFEQTTGFLRGLGQNDAMKESTSSSDFVMNACLSLMCVLMAGCASGLTQVSTYCASLCN
jgi:hypothetical protein